MALVRLGTIVRTHGVKGAFVVSTDSGKDSALGLLKAISINGTSYPIAEAAWMPSGWKVAVLGIESQAQAAALKGKDIFVERSELPELPQDEYYLDDLEGCEAFDEMNQKKIGHFEAIENLNGSDVWRFQIQGKSVLVIPNKRYIGKIERKKRIFLRHLSELKLK